MKTLPDLNQLTHEQLLEFTRQLAMQHQSLAQSNQQRLKLRSVMHKTSEKIAKQKKVLTKAVLSSAKQLGLTLDQLAIVINLDSVETLNSLELDPDSSQGELAIILIRIAISLDALTGGEAKWMQHFMKSPNKLTKGIPIKQIQTTQGLATVLNVVEGLRLQGKY